MLLFPRLSVGHSHVLTSPILPLKCLQAPREKEEEEREEKIEGYGIYNKNLPDPRQSYERSYSTNYDLR